MGDMLGYFVGLRCGCDPGRRLGCPNTKAIVDLTNDIRAIVKLVVDGYSVI
jgi:hypothetical protein